MTDDRTVLVVGAGVIGLTTAVCLAEAGKRVHVWTAERPGDTTSAAAGAMWGPYLVEPRARTSAWSTRTLAVLKALAVDPATGVRLVAGTEASRTAVRPPGWAGQLDEFRMCEPSELPTGFITGWRYVAPLVDMPTYLGYLESRLRKAGGTVELRRIESLDEATAVSPLIVNCTGMGARNLVPDPSVEPIRGQLLVVENPGIDEFFSEDTGLSPDLLHWYPHGSTLVLGGLAAAGQSIRVPDPITAQRILQRCALVEPRLRDARIIEDRVGLRPARPAVRLDSEDTAGGRIIHNYGHGGAGVTLSWGCAEEICAALDAEGHLSG